MDPLLCTTREHSIIPKPRTQKGFFWGTKYFPPPQPHPCVILAVVEATPALGIFSQDAFAKIQQQFCTFLKGWQTDSVWLSNESSNCHRADNNLCRSSQLLLMACQTVKGNAKQIMKTAPAQLLRTTFLKPPLMIRNMKRPGVASGEARKLHFYPGIPPGQTPWLQQEMKSCSPSLTQIWNEELG